MRLMGRKTNSQPEENKGSPSRGPLLFQIIMLIAHVRAQEGFKKKYGNSGNKIDK